MEWLFELDSATEEVQCWTRFVRDTIQLLRGFSVGLDSCEILVLSEKNVRLTIAPRGVLPTTFVGSLGLKSPRVPTGQEAMGATWGPPVAQPWAHSYHGQNLEFVQYVSWFRN